MSPQGEVGLLDRPSVALANLLKGEIKEAGLALVSPSSLSPSYRGTLAQMVHERIGDNALLKGAASIVSDPLFLLGIALSARYPVAKAKNMFKAGRRSAKFMTDVGKVEAKITRAESMLRGTAMEGKLIQVYDDLQAIEKKAGNLLDDGIRRFEKVAGRPPTHKELLRVGYKVEGWTKPGGPPWFRRRWGDAVPTNKAMFKEYTLTKAERKLFDFFRREHPDRMFKEIYEPLMKSEGGRRAIALSMGAPSTASPALLRARIKEGYLPHMPLRSPEGERAFLNMMADLVGERPDIAASKQVAAVHKIKGRPMHRRQGGMLPNLEEAAQIKGYNPEFGKFIREAIKSRGHQMSQQIPGVLAKASKMRRDKSAQYIRSWFDRDGDFGKRPGPAIPSKGYDAEIHAMSEFAATGKVPQAQTLANHIITNSVGTTRYSANPLTAWTGYIRALSRPYVWYVPKAKGEMALGAQIEHAHKALPPQLKAIMNDYIPILQGKMNVTQVKNMLQWNATRSRAMGWLETKGKGLVPEKWRQSLLSKLSQERGPFSYQNATNSIAAYFYYSTLGFNPSSAFLNMLQPVLTTMTMAGTRATWHGFWRAERKMRKYFKLRFGAKKLDPEMAIAEAFPDFAKVPTLAQQTSVSHNILRRTLDHAWLQSASHLPQSLHALAKTAAHPSWDKMSRAAMAMFARTELFNRLMTFEAGMWKAAQGGMKVAKSRNFAAKLTRMTQFSMGPGQMPHGLLNLSAPWRQFMYFPMRYLGFLWESTRLPWGSGPLAKNLAKWEAGARNWGTIGRSLASSRALWHTGKDVIGTELEGGLMTGALPLPQFPESPFYPFPIVPPVVSLPGLAVKAAATEDVRPLERAASLLVPGGVQLQRLYKTIRFARWNDRTSDGKVPVTDRQGSTVGYYRPMQLYMRAVGMQPDAIVKERELTGYLLKQRDRIRDFRREYVDAVYDNDPDKAERVQASFRHEYPNLPPLQTKDVDLKAAERRRTMSRIQRLLDTFPAAYRQEFKNVVSAAFGAEFGAVFPKSAPTSFGDALLNAEQRGITEQDRWDISGGGPLGAGVFQSPFNQQSQFQAPAQPQPSPLRF